MQIKLIQTEIEEAIRNYISEQVAVKPGMEINITLSATRGDEGFIANVEITRSAGAQATAVQTPQAQPESSPAIAAAAPTVSSVKRVAPKAVATAAAPAPVEPVAEPEVIDAGGDVAEAPVEATSNVAEAEAPTERPVTKSLFGGLAAPKNA